MGNPITVIRNVSSAKPEMIALGVYKVSFPEAGESMTSKILPEGITSERIE